MTVLAQKCEDCLLRVIEKEDKIGPLFENLILAQNYTLERVKNELVKKTQKLSIEEVQGHELYKQVEPLSQRKMIELQMSNIVKRLHDAKADLMESKAENSRLQDKIKNMEYLASEGLQYFDSVVHTLADHIRVASNTLTCWDSQLTTDQNLSVIRYDMTNRQQSACWSLSNTYTHLRNLQNDLKAIKGSN